jgi:hypothetical protein
MMIIILTIISSNPNQLFNKTPSNHKKPIHLNMIKTTPLYPNLTLMNKSLILTMYLKLLKLTLKIPKQNLNNTNYSNPNSTKKLINPEKNLKTLLKIPKIILKSKINPSISFNYQKNFHNLNNNKKKILKSKIHAKI